MTKNSKALVGFPMPAAVKGASQGDLRGERAKGEGGAGEEVSPEGEDEKGGEGAQRRACEQPEGRVLGALPVHEAVDDEVGQVRLGDKEGGF